MSTYEFKTPGHLCAWAPYSAFFSTRKRDARFAGVMRSVFRDNVHLLSSQQANEVDYNIRKMRDMIHYELGGGELGGGEDEYARIRSFAGKIVGNLINGIGWARLKYDVEHDIIWGSERGAPLLTLDKLTVGMAWADKCSRDSRDEKAISFVNDIFTSLSDDTRDFDVILSGFNYSSRNYRRSSGRRADAVPIQIFPARVMVANAGFPGPTFEEDHFWSGVSSETEASVVVSARPAPFNRLFLA